ncbi:MAG TPA: cysteine desulfurase family protein [Symbiobacteriaceae bacterium]|nr:cysteine desulfurase family protein [Symbiobacteriaceae bacterium]
MKLPVYLDYNATTPVDPAVLEAMFPYLAEHFGNPHSSHSLGATAATAVAEARGQVAGLLCAKPDEIVFTACASESNNMAIKGVAFARREQGRHIITTAVEHPAVLNTCRYLEQEFGFAVTVLPVDGTGRIDPDAVRRAIRPDTVLISVMQAQNETGVLQPVAEVGRIAREHDVLFHVDAAQAVGKVAVDVGALQCDLLTVAGHKLYAPKGVGALYVRSGVQIHPLVHGAAYEGGRRAGTDNVAYAVALGRACALAAECLAAGEPRRVGALRDRLHLLLAERLPLHLNGHETERLPNTLNVSIVGTVGNDLLAALPEVAASTGSACHAGVSRPSDTLLAMGIDPQVALGALRLSLGRYTTAEAIDFAAERIIAGAVKLLPPK